MSTETTTGAFDPAFTLKALVTPEYVEGASRLLSEEPAAVEKALRGAIPALLGGIAGQVTDQAGANRVVRLIEGSALPLPDVTSLLSDGTAVSEQLRAGTEIVRAIFGARSTRLIEAVAEHSGIRKSSSASILGLSAPLVLEKLRQLTAAPNSSWLMDVVGAQRTAIFGLLPPEISTMTGLGGGLLAAGTVKAAPPPPPAVAPPKKPVFGTRRLILIAVAACLVLILAAGAAYLKRGKKRQSDTGLISISLPDRVVINVPANGFQRALHDFLAKPVAADLPKRFLCGQIDFYPGSSRLKPSSMDAVDTLAAILKAYPAASFKIEAYYADPASDKETNTRVALDRTHAVAARVESARIDAQRMESGVYVGEPPPARKAGNSTTADEGALWLVITKLE